jgi:hypothetical protein
MTFVSWIAFKSVINGNMQGSVFFSGINSDRLKRIAREPGLTLFNLGEETTWQCSQFC